MEMRMILFLFGNVNGITKLICILHRSVVRDDNELCRAQIMPIRYSNCNKKNSPVG